MLSRGYKVRYGKTGDKNSATWTAISDSDATTVSHTVTGLDNGSEYSFKVRAVNSGGDGIATDWVTATPVLSTPAVAPTRPTNVVATAGNRQVALTWTKPPGTITGYEVRYLKGVGSYNQWAAIPDSDATTVSHTVMVPGGSQYSFQIRAVNGALKGTASATVTATPTGASTPILSAPAAPRARPR